MEGLRPELYYATSEHAHLRFRLRSESASSDAHTQVLGCRVQGLGFATLKYYCYVLCRVDLEFRLLATRDVGHLALDGGGKLGLYGCTVAREM